MAFCHLFPCSTGEVKQCFQISLNFWEVHFEQKLHDTVAIHSISWCLYIIFIIATNGNKKSSKQIHIYEPLLLSINQCKAMHTHFNTLKRFRTLKCMNVMFQFLHFRLLLVVYRWTPSLTEVLWWSEICFWQFWYRLHHCLLTLYQINIAL